MTGWRTSTRVDRCHTDVIATGRWSSSQATEKSFRDAPDLRLDTWTSRHSESFERMQQPVVDGQQLRLGELGEQPAVRAIASGDGEVPEQSRGARVDGALARPAGALGQGAREKTLPDARGPTRMTFWCSRIQPQLASASTTCRSRPRGVLKSTSSSEAG